jgi:hypothetical protein
MIIFFFFKKDHYFCLDSGSGRFHPELFVKRESGVNPEQTRCCKPPQNLQAKLKSTVSKEMGREPEDGVSQKTCRN